MTKKPKDRKREKMSMYAIVIDGKTVDYLTAENAESAARAYSAKMGPDSDLGFIRGVKMLDANTGGREWAIIKTDGGDITARLREIKDREIKNWEAAKTLERILNGNGPRRWEVTVP